MLGACWGDDGADRNATHLWNANIASRRDFFLNVTQAQCLADANCGCAAVTHCLGLDVTSTAALDCVPSCDGDVYTLCGAGLDAPPGYALSLDCGKIGQSCDVVAECVDDVIVSCDGSEPATCRDGARPLYCDDGALREGPDCDGLGLGCLDGKCQGTGATCVNTTSSREEVVVYDGVSCQDGVLDACVDGKQASFTCAEQGPGFTCQSVMGVPFCGLASDCLPARDGSPSEANPPACDGNSVTFCNAGRLDEIDCLSLGFTGCQVDRSAGLYGCTPTLTY